MCLNLKMQMGEEEPNEIIHGFSLCPRIFNAAFFYQRMRAFAFTFCDCDNVKEILLVERK